METIPTTVILPYYNHVDMTVRCLRALVSNPDLPQTLILINNGSNEDSAPIQEVLAGLDGIQVKILELQPNQGYIGAVNAGWKNATSEFITLLSNDTIPLPGWLSSLHQLMLSRNDAGAIGSKLLTPQGHIEESGCEVDYTGMPIQLCAGMHRSDPIANAVKEVAYCSGASLHLRRQALGAREELLDRSYGLGYFEDTDLCTDIRERGYAVLVQPASEVIHLGSQTFGRAEAHQTQMQQNQQTYRQRWMVHLSKRLSYTELETRRKYLFCDYTFPWFDRSAGGRRLWSVMKLIRQHHRFADVRFVSLYNNNLPQYVSELQQMGIETYAGDGTIGSIPWTRLLHETRPDHVWLCTPEIYHSVSPVVRALSPGSRIVYDTVDIHVKRTAQGAAYGYAVNDQDFADMLWKETNACKTADVVVVVSETDGDWMSAFQQSIEIVPIIHEQKSFGRPFVDRSGFLFVGNFNHTPNIDAVKYFCSEIFPLVLLQIPKAEFYIIGNNPPDEVKNLSGTNIHVLGYVPDLTPYYTNTRVVVAPLRFGSGIKGKIGEAMEYAVPFVATQTAAEGMNCAGCGLVVPDGDPKGFAEAVISIYSEADRWEALREGHQTVHDAYSPHHVLPILNRLLDAPRSQHPSVSIIILCWNQLDNTIRTVDSVLQHTFVPFRMIIVDNMSTDGTRDYLLDLKGQIENLDLVLLDRNYGFAGGINAGLATVSTADYVVILNNDVQVTPGWLERMLVHLKRNPRLGMIGPVACNVSGVQNSAYDSSRPLAEHAREVFGEWAGQIAFTQRIVGFAWVMRGELIQHLGGFDLRFGLGNFEDDDYCIRVLNAGYQVAVAKDVFVYHVGSASWDRATWVKQMQTNIELLNAKWGPVYDSQGYWIERTPGPFEKSRHYFPPIKSWTDINPELHRTLVQNDWTMLWQLGTQSFMFDQNAFGLIAGAIAALKLSKPRISMQLLAKATPNQAAHVVEQIKLWLAMICLHSINEMNDCYNLHKMALSNGYNLLNIPSSEEEREDQIAQLLASFDAELTGSTIRTL